MRRQLTPGQIDTFLQRLTRTERKHATQDIVMPFNGEHLYDLPLGHKEDVALAFARAKRAQQKWAARTPTQRAEILKRFHDLILNRQDEILDTIQVEGGKARKDAFEEVSDVANLARHYAYHAPGLLRPRRRRGAFPVLTETWEFRHPVGVVGIISPWNYPLSMAITDALPALMAGNAIVLKPAEQTTLTALHAAMFLDRAGLPPGLFQVVAGTGSRVGTTIIEHADMLVFTGSTATGRTVAEQAGKRLISCTLELGGKNPMVVFSDADLGRAVDGAIRGCFTNAGQLCISIERLYVHQSLFERFLKQFVARTSALRLAADFNYTADMGSLISQAHLEKVTAHVDDAVQKGATVRIDGKARPDIGPLFFEPTILTDVSEKMQLFEEETFGPVVSVYPFRTIGEVIEMANATEYGLNASIWTRDITLAKRVASRIQAGTVNINEAYAATWGSVDAPMGGFKQSGIGRRHGDPGLLKYTEPQTVSVERFLPVGTPRGVSEKTYARILTVALKMMSRIPGIR